MHFTIDSTLAFFAGIPHSRVGELFVYFWMAILGGCLGSFLNVVIYRLPRRESLTYPPSHCPLCGHAIRWYHNLPVLGWLMLRGRCYDCGNPIAPRYPLVEGVMACTFALITAVTIDWPSTTTGGSPFEPFEYLLDVALVGRLTLLTILLAWALIEYDVTPGKSIRYPDWTKVFLAAALLFSLLFAEVHHPSLAGFVAAHYDWEGWWVVPADALVGIILLVAVALFFGRTWLRTFPDNAPSRRIVLYAAVCGSFLGAIGLAGGLIATILTCFSAGNSRIDSVESPNPQLWLLWMWAATVALFAATTYLA